MASQSGSAQRAATETYSFLQIDKNVVKTPGRTISVQHIATVSIQALPHPSQRYLVNLSLIGLAIGLFVLVSGAGPLDGYGQRSQGLPLAIMGGAVVGLVVAALLRKTFFLIIGSNDGARTTFTSRDRKLLEAARDVLTQKLNEDGVVPNVNINFETGKIEGLNVATLNAGTVVAGSNNNVAANSHGARIGTRDVNLTANNSPGAQLGTGNTATGTQSTSVMVDYSTVLPHVEEWQRYAASNQGWEQVADKLSELELLMRSGTPSSEQKNKVRSLSVDLSTILQGYPAAVQLFQAVARAAGF